MSKPDSWLLIAKSVDTGVEFVIWETHTHSGRSEALANRVILARLGILTRVETRGSWENYLKTNGRG